MATNGGKLRRINAACQDLIEETFSEEATVRLPSVNARRIRLGHGEGRKMKVKEGRLELVQTARFVDLPAGSWHTDAQFHEYLFGVCRGWHDAVFTP